MLSLAKIARRRDCDWSGVENVPAAHDDHSCRMRLIGHWVFIASMLRSSSSLRIRIEIVRSEPLPAVCVKYIDKNISEGGFGVDGGWWAMREAMDSLGAVRAFLR